jgi:hypothetical protein
MLIIIRREDVQHLEMRTDIKRLHISSLHEEIILNTDHTSFVKDSRLGKIIIAERVMVEIHYHGHSDLLEQEFAALAQGLLPTKA